ncbi:MAG TPA: EAL domain-containing protein [Geminicoccaceae bacterium]|nr:EAL domain-containing protein [Geminicoccaceae bacterium]
MGEPTSAATEIRRAARPTTEAVSRRSRRLRAGAGGSWTRTVLPRLRRVRRRWTYGLTRKFRLFIIVMLTALTATLTAVGTLAEQHLTEERLRQRAKDTVTRLASFADGRLTEPNMAELQHVLAHTAAGEDVLYAYVLDPGGALLLESAGAAERQLPVVDDPLGRETLAQGVGRLVRDEHGLHAAAPIDFGGTQVGVVRLGLSTAGMERDILALTQRNLAAGLAFLGVSLLFSLPLVRRITRPLAQLTKSSVAASRGEFDRRIAIRTNDELEPLAAAFNRMLSQLSESTAQVHRLAYFDSITDLPNRIQFRQLLGQALAAARRHQRRGAVLFLDLDRFKLINDSFGHDAGDRLLQAFARRLTACLRGSDVVARADREGPAATVARLGGDEFTILLAEIHDPGDPARVAERVLAALDQPFDLGGQAVVVGTSIGIALFPDDGADPETLLKNADAAMYHAKGQGRNGLKFYSRELGVRALERLTMERELRVALERDELELYYQPQLHPSGSAVLGLEALLRWPHPRLGIVPASTILGLAKDIGLIVPLCSWVLRQACAEAQSWPAVGPGPLRIGVNLSALQMLQADFVERLAGVLEASGLPPERLELEITETAAAADAAAMATRLAALKRLGVGLAIDDFGTGQSSLSSLRHFRPDRLKIDRSFIHDIDADADCAALVSAIIALAHSLELEVAAAGVETERQAEFLRRRGCHRLQGFLFAPPLPAAEVAPWLRRWQTDQARPALIERSPGTLPDQ